VGVVTGENPLPPRSAAGWQEVDWRKLDLPTMWSYISKEHNEQAWDQIRVWNRTSGTLLSYRDTLDRLARGLAEDWPPVPDSPALYFQQQLAALIEAVHQTADDASANGTALANISDTLMGARAKVEDLKKVVGRADTGTVLDHPSRQRTSWLRPTRPPMTMPPN